MDEKIKSKPVTIDEYILMQPENIREILNKVRRSIREVLPDAKECISWSMPTYKGKQNIIHFAAFKNHLGIYPGDKAIEYFKDRLDGYRFSKGAVQFQYNEPVPYDLIAQIAKWCHETGNHH